MLLRILSTKSLSYKYCFATSLPPLSFFNRNIFNIVLENIEYQISHEGIFIIFTQTNYFEYNISCFRCKLITAKKYKQCIHLIEKIIMELLFFIL